MTKVSLVAVAALVLPLGLSSAYAQDKGDTLTLGDGPATGKRLSKEQLRECLAMQPQLKSQSDDAVSARSELDAAKAEFDRLEGELQSTRASVNASDKAAVDTYNEKVERRKQLVADYNTKLPAVNDQVQRYNTLQQTWKSDCEDRPYSEDDYAAIPRRK